VNVHQKRQHSKNSAGQALSTDISYRRHPGRRLSREAGACLCRAGIGLHFQRFIEKIKNIIILATN
jgi:hypothetical protein